MQKIFIAFSDIYDIIIMFRAGAVLNMIIIKDGALAQLGARNIRIVEAVGSNPICSI